jgi:NAD(P)H-flavin reductase
LRFIPTLDGLTAQDSWSREVGTVTQAIQRQVDNAQPFDAYLCGAPPMCDAVGRLLLAKGLPENQLFFDRFFAAGR